MVERSVVTVFSPISEIDILKGFIEQDQITVEEAQKYESHISEIEEDIQ